MFNRKYSTGFCKFSDGTTITDEQVAEYVREHTHWWDRLDYHKICDAASLAFDILCGAVEEPKKKRWYF